eukprot:GEMP01036738.1.p1 GENE.GEMP01036738.1~~GEMP01036738.1.p1  ORF type:complete len:308 (+),score=49.72 GEMP01036738.1:82-1005(+)
MAVHHSALPRTYIEGSAGTSTYKEDCDGLSSSDELMKALFSSPEFALQCDLPVSSRTTHCGTSYDGGIHSPRLSLSLRHDESPPSQASSRTLCPTESFSPADNATQPAGERTMPRGHVQSALRGGVQFWDRRPAERDEACHDYEKYVQRIDLLEKQLRQRTETARDFAETIDHLMMKHQLMENQIATVVASQGEFLQDFSLFLVARDILSKATSLEMFKEQIATRLGPWWTPRLEMRAENLYHTRRIEDVSKQELALEICRRGFAPFVGARKQAKATIWNLTTLPVRATFLSFRVAKSVVNFVIHPS